MKGILIIFILVSFGRQACSLEVGEFRIGLEGLQVAFSQNPGTIDWFYVSENGFKLSEASLACRALSNSFLVSYTSKTFQQGPLVRISCRMSDTSIADCNLIQRGSSRTVNITCLEDSSAVERTAGQLADGRALVRVFQRQRYVWGHVCVENGNEGFGVTSANLFCINLGYDRTISGGMSELNVGEEVLTAITSFNCSSVTSFNNCTFSVANSCRFDNVIAVQCEKDLQDASVPTIRGFVSSQSKSNNTLVSPTLSIVDSKGFLIGFVVTGAAILCLAALLCCSITFTCLCIRKRKNSVTVINNQYLASRDNVEGVQINMSSNHYQTPDTIFTNSVAQEAQHTILFKTLRINRGEMIESETAFDIPLDYDPLIYGMGNIVPTMEERYEGSVPAIDSLSENRFSGYVSGEKMVRPCFVDKKTLQFWNPQDTLKGLFGQMSRRGFREILYSSLTLENKLGEGNFGYVYSGTWRSPDSAFPVPVAIKGLKKEEEESNIDFLKEAAILGQFDHPNVLKLLGVVTLTHPHMMVMELLSMGLKDFLKMTFKSGDIDFNIFAPLFLRFSLDIANGMQHLTSKLYVHRDLAARNILLSHALSCKIGDFGLARRARIEDDYYVSSGGLIPFRWTAPEAICYNKYSEKSDVWSYGITLYEVWSVGQDPWANLRPQKVIDNITVGTVMSPPSGCPRPIYKLMTDCWNIDKLKRPSFTEIAALLEEDENNMLLKRGPTSAEKREMGKPQSVLEKNMFLDLQNRYAVKRSKHATHYLKDSASSPAKQF